MEVKTHARAVHRLLGTPVHIEDDKEAEVRLEATEEMAVDERGLVHGGFTFGLADLAAMLAVNHPNVVLGGSESRFLAPVRVGDVMRARAVVVSREGRRREIEVKVTVGENCVFKGAFTCYVLDRHILER